MFTASTVVLIIYAIYGPTLFLLYLTQVLLVIANKKKPQFRSSYFNLYIIEAFTGLATFLVTMFTDKLVLFPEVNSFYANFPANGFTTGLYFSSYYFSACEEYVQIFIALNRLSALTIYTKYEQLWKRVGWICLPVIFGFPFISYYHLLDVRVFFAQWLNDTAWAIDYDHSVRPWRSNRRSAFYLYLICSTTTLTINLASVIALRCVKRKASSTEIRLFLLGMTSFACSLPMTIQQFVFMFTTSFDEMNAMTYRIPWLLDLKALTPGILSLIFSTAIRNELMKCLKKRKPTSDQLFLNSISIIRS